MLDTVLASFLPALLRLIFWAVLASIATMLLYWWLSPQQRIATLQARSVAARRELDGFDGAFADAMPLMKRMLGLSLRHVGAVLAPAIIASLPLLCLLVWMGTAYGYSMPTPTPATPLTVAPPWHAQWVTDGTGGLVEGTATPRLQVLNGASEVVGDYTLTAPVPRLHKFTWWNWLFGNPAGYLPSDAPYERVVIGLHPRTYLPFGPQWLRGWEVPFLTMVFLVSLTIKLGFRIR